MKTRAHRAAHAPTSLDIDDDVRGFEVRYKRAKRRRLRIDDACNLLDPIVEVTDVTPDVPTSRQLSAED
jgi:hypothetical protein